MATHPPGEARRAEEGRRSLVGARRREFVTFYAEIVYILGKSDPSYRKMLYKIAVACMIAAVGAAPVPEVNPAALSNVNSPFKVLVRETHV